LDAEPGNLLLRQEAAALLLITGDVEGSAAGWQAILEERPGDGLALYGLAIAALNRGDVKKARELIEQAGRDGDRATCLIAERYLETLSGASGAGLGMTLPDVYVASARGLSGMAAARTGNAQRAMTELAETLANLPGDPYYETPGLVMSFDSLSPIRFGYKPLPTGNGLSTRRGKSGPKGFTGTVTLAPDDPGPEAGFVVFKIDGVLTKMANTRPFNLVWNTAQSRNGAHRVEIVVYDKQGAVLSQAEKFVNTQNASAPTSAQPYDAGGMATRTLLWEALALRPSRHTVAYAAAVAAEKLGNQKAAISFLNVAAALDPNYRDTRARLESVMPTQSVPAIWRGDPNQPVIALTFDDGPKPGLTDKLVDVLVRESVPATFFVIGRHTTNYPGLVKKIADAGFQIENHSYTHPNLCMLSQPLIEAELLKTIASVYASTGRTMRYYRPPGGNTNGDVGKAAAKWGLTACMWTVDADALENGSPDKLVDFVLKKAAPGAIILLHNGRQTTINALPRIIAGLRQRGFRFDTIDGLLNRKTAIGVAQAPLNR
jgi:peptidoglycan/xylan/chitin deacetylase (PgdA/CDA1 family)